MATPADATMLATADMAETQQTEQDKASAYLEGRALVVLCVAFMSVSFVLALDNTILATAIPQITSDFRSLNDMGWYGSSYLIAQMALLPTCGRLYTFFDLKWTYCAFLAAFELGSILSAVAPGSTVLIVGRCVTGLGAAGLLGGATIILSRCVALTQRPLVMAIVLGMYSVGSATGPLVGGAITDNKSLTWRFIFWINLPFGAVTMALLLYVLRTPPPPAKAGLSWKQKIRQLDLLGATLLLGLITCLNLALQWGGIVYPWSNPNVFGCLIGFGLLLLVFLYLQRRGKESATINLEIFRNRTVYVACGFMMLVQMAMVLQTYYWPIFFQSVKNNSARDSGIYTLPIIVSNSVATLAAGWFSSRTRHYVPLMWVGAPLLAAGGGLYQLIYAHSPVGYWIGFQILSGAGYGICSQMPILAVQVVLQGADVPTGMVMVLLFQCLGGALAPSIGQNIFTDKLVRYMGQVRGVDGQAVVAAGGRDFRNIVPPGALDAVINAFSAALRDVFWVALAAPVLGWVLSWAMEWRRIPKDGAKTDVENVVTAQTPATEVSEK